MSTNKGCIAGLGTWYIYVRKSQWMTRLYSVFSGTCSHIHKLVVSLWLNVLHYRAFAVNRHCAILDNSSLILPNTQGYVQTLEPIKKRLRNKPSLCTVRCPYTLVYEIFTHSQNPASWNHHSTYIVCNVFFWEVYQFRLFERMGFIVYTLQPSVNDHPFP